MTERLRKDLIKPFTRIACERELHPECFTKILNSLAQQPLAMKCLPCKEKYLSLASQQREDQPSQAKKASQKVGLRKYLLARNIALERQNALLEKEVADLKVLLNKPGKGKPNL